MPLVSTPSLHNLLRIRPFPMEDIFQSLPEVNFTDRSAAIRSLQQFLVQQDDPVLLSQFLPLLFVHLKNAASPDVALAIFQHFIEKTENRPHIYNFLITQPRTVEILVKLFAGSQFLSQILLRHPVYFEMLTTPKQLLHPGSKEHFLSEALREVRDCRTDTEKMDALRRYQQKELLRIGAADLLALSDLHAVMIRLSDLADAVVTVALQVASEHLHIPLQGFSVLALGKLGGQELNYSSDIDLLFLAQSENPDSQRLAQHLIAVLTHATGEGFLYRVDTRLRPWGRTGRLVPSPEEHLAYLKQHARLWEKQAMLKARWIAGDEDLGLSFLREVRPFIFNLPEKELRQEVRAMKKRIETNLRLKGREWGEVKKGKGSIRDVEFVCQYLQLRYGRKHPEIHSRNTLDTLARLTACHLLNSRDFRILSEGYTFLRTVEHHLQLMHNRQTHQLPEHPKELHYLAQRLGFEGRHAASQLVKRYQQHRDALRNVFLQYLGDEEERQRTSSPQPLPQQKTGEQQHQFIRLHQVYTEMFNTEQMDYHARLTEQLDEQHPVIVDARKITRNRWQVTIVGYDFPGELSIICGLLFVHGFNIIEGQIFTDTDASGEQTINATPVQKTAPKYHRRRRNRKNQPDSRRKIIDVFTVSPISETPVPSVWEKYQQDLTGVVRLLRNKQQQEAHGLLAHRVARTLQESPSAGETILMPVIIDIDNSASPHYSLLHIDAPDTPGFLYELTNALSLNGIYISRVMVNSVEDRIHDTLFITDTQGRKIIQPEKLRQLRMATLLVKQFTHLLPHSPNPESAMLHFRELVSQIFEHENWADKLITLENPKVMSALARLLGVSDFLWEDFLRLQHSNLFPILKELDALKNAPSINDWQQELAEQLAGEVDFNEKKRILNNFKDREMFRIDMRYILGAYHEFWQFSEELSKLVEIVLRMAYRICFDELTGRYGIPMIDWQHTSRLCVCALGKFGGKELGFASDIELLFVFQGEGKTSGEVVITSGEFYEKLVYLIRDSIVARREGIFEIDLRLRPYGRAGRMAVTLEQFRTYFSPDGPAWQYERQALIKLRPIIGDPALIQQVLVARDECVFSGEPYDVNALRALRERQVRQLVSGGTINSKYSPGGLVDLEYLIQALQMNYGDRHTNLRKTNTNEAMKALAETGLIPRKDFFRLQKAHLFLRTLIEALRMVRGNAKDLTVPPVASNEFSFLARRLGYEAIEKLWQDILEHTRTVQEISERLLAKVTQT